MTLSVWSDMSGKDRLDTLLRGLSPENTVEVLRHHLKPYMQSKRGRSTQMWNNLLLRKMRMTAAESGGIETVAAVIRASARTVSAAQRILRPGGKQILCALQ